MSDEFLNAVLVAAITGVSAETAYHRLTGHDELESHDDDCPRESRRRMLRAHIRAGRYADELNG